ncbi:MAG: hypothetical protein Q9210_003957, partial [Variospora velana]
MLVSLILLDKYCRIFSRDPSYATFMRAYHPFTNKRHSLWIEVKLNIGSTGMTSEHDNWTRPNREANPPAHNQSQEDARILMLANDESTDDTAGQQASRLGRTDFTQQDLWNRNSQQMIETFPYLGDDPFWYNGSTFGDM